MKMIQSDGFSRKRPMHCTAIVVAVAAAYFAVIFYLLLISFVPINFQLMHSIHLCCMLCASMLGVCVYVCDMCLCLRICDCNDY